MPRIMQRGDVYALRADDVGKPRRVIVVSPPQLNGKRDTVLVVPLYGSQVAKRSGWHGCVRIDGVRFGLDKESVANAGDAFAVRLLLLNTGSGRLGKLDDATLRELDEALRVVFGLTPWPGAS